MRIPFLYRSLFLFILPITLFSQNKYDWEQFINESADYYSSPFNWASDDFITFGLVAAGTAGLMRFDDNIKNEFEKINSDKKYWLMEAGRYWGEPLVSLAISGLLLLHGISYNNTTTKKIGFEVAQSFVYSVSVTSLLKISFGRSRPYTGKNSNSYSPLSFREPNWSFPSGHSTVAFSLSAVLAANTDNTFLKIASFLPAVLTLTSRVYQDYHWASDVFLGAAIGYFSAKYVTELHRQNDEIGIIKRTPLLSISLTF